MKFSYSWLKNYIPELPKKSSVIDILSTRSFEAEDAPGDCIEIKLPPNRYADCASHLGMAREFAAVSGLTYTTAKIPPLKKISRGWLPVKIQDKKNCTVYTATFADAVRIEKSPKWLTDRLTACGLRPINNIVDVMNYVMLELGQPLHAFDADMLRGAIIVRPATRGERMTTLDGQEFILTPETLVIADNDGPLAIAGIKGGKRAEVGPDTKRIVIESAHFDPISIYKTSRRLKLATDASARFMHTLSPETALRSGARAAELLKELGATKVITGTFVAGSVPKSSEVIDVDLSWLSRFLGVALSGSEIKKALKPLGFSVFPGTKNVIRIAVPNYRTDIELPEDVAEEIARIYGYDNIPSAAPHIIPHAEPNARHDLVSTLRSTLVACNYSELYTHSFIPTGSHGHRALPTLQLENPISNEYAELRPSLYHNLMRAGIQENLRFTDTVRVFEVGTVFASDPKASEAIHIGITIARAKSSPEAVYRELKGVIDVLSRALHLPITYEDELEPASHMRAGHAASIKAGSGSIGYIGIPATRLDAPTAFAELSISRLLQLVPLDMRYKQPAKYPAIERDISMFVPRRIRVADAEHAIRESGIDHLTRVKLLDVYLPKEDRGRKSIAMRLTFRNTERTLTESEIEHEFEKAISALKKKIGAEIR